MALTKPRAYQIYDIDYKQATRAVTVANVTLGGGAPAVVDGVNLIAGDRILVTGQTDAKQNGIYVVSIVGSGSNGTWTRSDDTNSSGELLAGTIVMVTEGTGYADTQWKLITDNPIIIGTTELIFTQNYSANSISAGTSNVSVQSNANVTISSSGTANVVTVSNIGAYVSGVVSATGNIQGNYVLGNGSQLTGLPATYSNANVGAYLPTYTGNLTAGNISATGNITGAYIIGNGSQLTGLPAGYANSNAASYFASGNVTTNILTTANVSATGNVIGNNFVTNGSGGALSGTGNIIAGNVLTTGLVSATGNIQGNYVLGNGSQLSGLPATYSNANVAAYLPTYTGNLTAGNVSASGNILTAGLVSATGNVIGNNFVTSGSGGSLSGAGNITAGNVLTAGLISAGSNITGANIITAGTISATGNISTVGIINTANIYGSAGETISTGGNANINLYPGGSGNIVLPSGNVTYINNLASPVRNSDAATKQYVDNLVTTAISYHQGVTAATTANLATTTSGTVTYTQPNGAGNGIGAKLTTTGAFNLIDTANVQTVGTRILVKNEGNAVFNGVYTWANATNIVRSTDADEYGPASPDTLSINDYFFVASGNVNAGSAWIVDAPSGTITFGTSNITFAQFSSSQTYTAGNGISLAGTVINSRVDQVTTAFDGGGNIVVKASANLITPNIGAATGTSVSVTANVIGGNIVTSGLITATGNLQAGNILTSGLVSATGNINGTALSVVGNITGDTLSGSGNIIGGNLLTTGLISATGNVTGNFFIGNGSALTGIVAGSSSNISSGTSNVTVISSGGNVTVGVGGTANVAVFATTGEYVTGVVSASGNITGGNILTAGLISATGNITAGNLLISASGTVNAGNIRTTGLVSALGNIIGGNILTAGLISATGNITAGNLLISASGTVNAGNIRTTGLVSALGNIIGGNLILTGAITDSAQLDIQTSAANANIVLTPNGTGNVNTPANVSVTGNVQAGNVRTAGLISATGAITGSSATVGTGNITAGNLILTGAITDSAQLDIQTSAANANIVLTPNGTGNVNTPANVSVTGNVQAGNVSVGTRTVTLGNIVNANGNGVGNIGSASLYFNTAFVKSTSAQYADLAEMYVADQELIPGTVVEFGGSYEIRTSQASHSTAVAGIVSTNPSYLMNAAQPGEHTVPVALTGRVPCRVIGTIHKGDRLVASDTAGVACALDMTRYEPGCIIGKALENYDNNSVGVIEVAVGRT